MSVPTNGTLPRLKTVPSVVNKGALNASTHENQYHSYHKLFWRLNVTLEFNIFYHSDRQVYEVAAYNSEKDREYEALFLHEDGISQLSVGPEALNAEIEVIKTKLSKDRFNQMPGLDAIVERAKAALVKRSLEAHLNPQADGALAFVPLPGENFEVDSIVCTPPAEETEQTTNVINSESTETQPTSGSTDALVNAPAHRRRTVVHRHRASIHEYNRTLGILKQHSLDLKEASEVAENMLSLSELSVNAFKTALKNATGTKAQRAGFYDKKSPLGMFRWAVHRVVLQTRVDAVRARIDELNKKKAIRINGTFPVPGSTDLNNPASKILSLAGRLSASPQMQSLSESLSRECSPRGHSRSGRREKTNVVKTDKPNVVQSSSLPEL